MLTAHVSKDSVVRENTSVLLVAATTTPPPFDNESTDAKSSILDLTSFGSERVNWL